MAPKSATYTTRPEGTLSTFVTFRVAGDNLDPQEITRMLEIKPTHVHAKGQPYSTGRSNVVGATGVWLFSTDEIISSLNFYDHLKLALLLFGSTDLEKGRDWKLGAVKKFLGLSNILRAKSLTATMTFFWHGAVGAMYPEVPQELAELFALIPIGIEQDFDRDEDSTPRKSRAA